MSWTMLPADSFGRPFIVPLTRSRHALKPHVLEQLFPVTHADCDFLQRSPHHCVRIVIPDEGCDIHNHGARSLVRLPQQIEDLVARTVRNCGLARERDQPV
jgi:hypothetical protein